VVVRSFVLQLLYCHFQLKLSFVNWESVLEVNDRSKPEIL